MTKVKVRGRGWVSEVGVWVWALGAGCIVPLALSCLRLHLHWTNGPSDDWSWMDQAVPLYLL